MYSRNLFATSKGGDAPEQEASASKAAEISGLCEDILKQGVELRIKVTGQSMRPTIKTNDVVTLKKVPPEKLKIGDLILIKSDFGQLILHRLIKIEHLAGHTVYRTKGDSLLIVDGNVTADRILGKVCKIEKQNKFRTDFFVINLETMRGQLFKSVMMLLQLIIFFRFRIRTLRKRIVP